MKRTSLRSIVLLVVTAGCIFGPGFAQSAQPPTPEAAWNSYLAKLDAQCGDKHLNWYSPADLNDIVEDFTQHLAAEEKKTVQQRIDASCRNVEMGVTCANTGFLQAAVQLSRLDAFVTRVCQVPIRCKGQSDCTNTN